MTPCVTRGGRRPRPATTYQVRPASAGPAARAPANILRGSFFKFPTFNARAPRPSPTKSALEHTPCPARPVDTTATLYAATVRVSAAHYMSTDGSEQCIEPESVHGVFRTHAAHLTRVTVYEKCRQRQAFCRRNVLADVAVRTGPLCFATRREY